MKNAKENKGITLVALIITVIILLILAGVTISLVIGENGIIEKSKLSKQLVSIEDEKEKIGLAYSSAKIKKIEKGDDSSITAKELSDEFEPGMEAIATGSNPIMVVFNLSKREYSINENGEITLEKAKEATDEKYFSINVDETTKEATITGVKEEYRENAYYTWGSTETEYCVAIKADNNKYITDVVIPSKITYNGEEYTVTSIGEGAFCVNALLSVDEGTPCFTSFIMPDTIKNIGDWAFAGLKEVEKIEIPESVINIGCGAFSACSKIKNIELPSKINKIEDSVFSNCKSLTSIKIPDKVTNIGEYAFRSCISLKNIEIPANVTNIGKFAFSYCKSLTRIKIPKVVTSIKERTFEFCEELESIEIPKDVTNIEKYTFFYCKNLTNVTISSKVTNIDESSFSGCTNLKTVNYEGSEEDWKAINIDSNNDELKNVKINYNYKYQE